MSLAGDLEKASIRMRCLLQRESLDEIVKNAPKILAELDGIVERVRGFEAVAYIDNDRLEKEAR